MTRKHFCIRLLVDFLIACTTLGGAYIFSRLLWSDGGTIVDAFLLLIFTLLYLWLSISFWIATLGLVLCLVSRSPSVAASEGRGTMDEGRASSIEYRASSIHFTSNQSR